MFLKHSVWRLRYMYVLSNDTLSLVSTYMYNMWLWVFLRAPPSLGVGLSFRLRSRSEISHLRFMSSILFQVWIMEGNVFLLTSWVRLERFEMLHHCSLSL